MQPTIMAHMMHSGNLMEQTKPLNAGIAKLTTNTNAMAT